ncbi:MAG: biopolymer transporter ExbD [Gammaproteobacteria bacterium]|jgi:biopolymer transport protein ExbD
MARKIRRGSDFQDLRRRLVGNKATQEENVIPMINVIFLLLLYFMIAGNLQPDYDVTPPFATQEAEPSKQLPTLSVKKDGSMTFENRPVTLDGLKAELARISGNEKLKIHADAKVDALKISRIMKTSAEAGILQFVLVTQRRVDGS